MNKAFVREPEAAGPRRCPRCDSLGVEVPAATLAAQLSEELRQHVADAAWFCPFPQCEVVYFDDFSRTVPLAEFGRPVYPKDVGAPICSCFGLTCDDIEQDLSEGGVRRVKAHLEQAKSPAAQCTLKAPSGQSCIAAVQKYYMQRR